MITIFKDAMVEKRVNGKYTNYSIRASGRDAIFQNVFPRKGIEPVCDVIRDVTVDVFSTFDKETKSCSTYFVIQN